MMRFCSRCNADRDTFATTMGNRPVECCRICGKRLVEGALLPDELRARLLTAGEQMGEDYFADAPRVRAVHGRKRGRPRNQDA